MNSELIRGLAGGMAGALATVPMTAAMRSCHHVLPLQDRTLQEPLAITLNMLSHGAPPIRLTASQYRRLGWLAHFGYGACVGALYGLLRRRGFSVSGPAYGMMVWGGNYCVMMPALRILPQPWHRPAGRTPLLILSHLVWGAALAAGCSCGRDERNETSAVKR